MQQAKQVTQPLNALTNVFEQVVTMHPLVPLAKAANILRTDVILLQERLASGQIKGEKRSDGDPSGKKNSWFIYASEFDRLLNDRLASYEYRSVSARITTDGLDTFFEPDIADDTDSADFNATAADGHDIAAASGAAFSVADYLPDSNDDISWQTDGIVLDSTDPQSEVTHIQMPEQVFPLLVTSNSTELVVAELAQHLQQEIGRTAELEKRIDTLTEEITRLRADLEISKSDASADSSSQAVSFFSKIKRQLQSIFK